MKNYRWQVRVKRYGKPIEVVSEHYRLSAACRRLASMIRKTRDMEEGHIFHPDHCSTHALNEARRMAAQGVL